MRNFIFISAINGFLAVAFGAFGAHALKARLSPDMLQIYDTGARYHLTHAIAILAVAILIGQIGQSKWLRWSGWLFTIGIILFSGSLYMLAITGATMLGAVTPIGGLCFLAAWACLAAGAVVKPPIAV